MIRFFAIKTSNNEKMMLPILLFLIAFPDVKRVPIEDDLIKDFTVTEIIDETTADCSENPSSGGPMDFQFLQIELSEFPTSEDSGIVPDFSGPSMLNDTSISVTQRVVPGTSPNPDPDPEPQNPIVVTPEPSPLAILTISCFALLYLLFGRSPGRRFFRRV